MKTCILALLILAAAGSEAIKDLELARTDEKPVAEGTVLALQATVSFNHKACDQAPENASFYAKGAEIVERSDWVRIDEFSFYKRLKVRVKDPATAKVTAVLIKHEQNETRQLRLAPQK